MSTSHTLRPFYFSTLNATFEKENMKTLDLISKLFLPLPLPKQPTPATSSEKMVEDMPEWVVKLIVDKGATFAWKVMEKKSMPPTPTTYKTAS
ncbi:hypothetical protein IEQ34_011963 [Dendrobium chrysotoxum]|uniref:Uncharacterized protein n=1 Tax=Dendrobium chrysotoxum TaxID=161865 RepID=A0AAV7GBK1_DENCH|nr:hypothetical protein IEQ34_011963 [Dendrobium chrysotoxum]